MTSPADLQNNLQDGIDTYNHWDAKLADDQATLQSDLKTMQSMSPDDALAYCVMVIFNDVCNVNGDQLAVTSSQLEIQSGILDYDSTLEGYNSEGANISDTDAANFGIDLNNFYTMIGGSNDPTNKYGTCPSWLSSEDQHSLIDNTLSISDAYCQEYKVVNPNAPGPTNKAYYTPWDVTHMGNSGTDSSDLVKTAQTNWTNEAKSTTDANGVHIGNIDGFFSQVTHAFQEINSITNSQNQSLSTQQKTWSDLYNQYQGVWKDMQNYFNTLETSENAGELAAK